MIQPEYQNDLIQRKNDLTKLLQETGHSLVKINDEKHILERELT